MEIREIPDLSPGERRRLFERSPGVDEVRPEVREVVDRVHEEGDVALREYAKEFDDVDVGNIEVTAEAARAHERIDDDLGATIDRVAGNVRRFHEDQLPDDWRREYDDGQVLGRRYRPVERVGVYVPDGEGPTGAIASVVPATVAGVEEVVVATPPLDVVEDATLAAIYAAGADTVYGVGGPQAIAALAYGTETVDPVPKVVGTGGKRVSAAAAEVQGDVAVEFPAGPHETLVIADDTADPEYVAADLVAAAEYAPDAAALAVTDDRETAAAVVKSIEEIAEGTGREETIREALDGDTSGAFLARSGSEAIAFAEEFGPQHLSVQTADPEAVLQRIPTAGAVSVGGGTPVAAGYATGVSDVVPSGSDLRVRDGLSVDDFLRVTSVQRTPAESLGALSETITTLAEREGFDAHAESVRRRLDR